MDNRHQSPLLFGHLNLHRSRAVNIQLSRDISELNLDIVGINEPYFNQKSIITDLSSNIKIYAFAHKPKAAILINRTDLEDFSVYSEQCIQAIGFTYGCKKLLFVSIYIPPTDNIKLHISKLQSLAARFTDRSVLITGDFNAKSPIWGGSTVHRSGPVLQFINQFDLIILNDPNSPPTYCTPQGQSWIDLMITNDTHFSHYSVADIITASDHELLTCTYTLDTNP
ncbi:uncharacterized protein [Parasteatoda tepidariorum]|uniref:uncharacterized protein n=1 Tax=Parasteatoda tepidariorum TaxID=114398 RepID=UPI0039BCF765